MVRTQDELNEIIKQYIEIVTKCFYVKKIILFGSYAHGKPHKDSDIDLAVVSPDFEYIPYEMSGKILFRLARFVDTSIEPVTFTECSCNCKCS